MQFMPATAKQYGITDPFDPAQSARAAAEYMHDLIQRFDGREDLAVAAYNYGPTRIDPDQGVPKNKETSGYVRTVLGIRNIMASSGGF